MTAKRSFFDSGLHFSGFGNFFKNLKQMKIYNTKTITNAAQAGIAVLMGVMAVTATAGEPPTQPEEAFAKSILEIGRAHV